MTEADQRRHLVREVTLDEELSRTAKELREARQRVEALENAIRAAWLALRADQPEEAQTILHVALE